MRTLIEEEEALARTTDEQRLILDHIESEYDKTNVRVSQNLIGYD